MKLFCPSCLNTLAIEHDVTIKLYSRFDWKPDRILLTAHTIKSMSGMKKMFNTDKLDTANCHKCGDIKISDAYVQCDDCGERFSHEQGIEIGSLIFCKSCIGSKRTFKDFDIFGKRAPSGKARERVIDENLQDAFVVANSDENISVEQMGQSININISEPPQETVSPNFNQEFYRFIDTNTQWTSTYRTSTEDTSGTSSR